MKKGIVISLVGFILFLYIFIIIFILFGVVHIHRIGNFIVAMPFEIIGIGILAGVILMQFSSKPIKVGYYVPLVEVMMVYTLLLNILNIWGSVTLGKMILFLLNFLLLFFYSLISIPMFIMGKR